MESSREFQRLETVPATLRLVNDACRAIEIEQGCIGDGEFTEAQMWSEARSRVL